MGRWAEIVRARRGAQRSALTVTESRGGARGGRGAAATVSSQYALGLETALPPPLRSHPPPLRYQFHIQTVQYSSFCSLIGRTFDKLVHFYCTNKSKYL